MEAAQIYEALGGAAGCRRLSEAFYARVGQDPLLRPIFPSGSLHCAIEEFAAYLVQFLDGPQEHSQRRWWLSLRESHSRFRIGVAERDVWMGLMSATLDELRAPVELHELFERASSYLIDREGDSGKALVGNWNAQLALDAAVAAIKAGDAVRAIALAPECNRAIMPGLLARMIRSRHPVLVEFAHNEIRRDPNLTRQRFAGRTLIHNAAGAGDVETVKFLLDVGADPRAEDGGGHTPLYSAANECRTGGAEIVRILVDAGADVNASGGVQRCTPLHMAARRGNVSIARALLDCGANIAAQDRHGDTPLRRALNCKKPEVAELLAARGASLQIS